ncbi:branched-chain alpha-ketoacid dehydrogenase [Baffinella frigidus]|nr:branched-chain alpha-ketoacid dehydrogenase [Cryptophyta sp. CCMP2293]
MKALRFLAQGLASPARRNPQWFGLRRDGLSVRDRRLSSSTPMPIPKLKEVTDQEKNILIWEYAEKPDYSLGIDDVYQLYHRGPHGKDALVQSAMFVKKLLPAMLAKRVKDLQAMPVPFQQTGGSIFEICALYEQSFLHVLQAPDPTTFELQEEFTWLLSFIKNQHLATRQLISQAFQNIRCTGGGEWRDAHGNLLYVDDPGRTKVQEIIQRFYNGRVALRLLVDQHVHLRRDVLEITDWQPKSGDLQEYVWRKILDKEKQTPASPSTAASRERYWGIVHPKLGVMSVLEIAAADAQSAAAACVSEACGKYMVDEIEIKFRGDLGASFTYVPEHLYLIAADVLANALRATAERHGPTLSSGGSLPPVTVTISEGSNIFIRITDQGGGVAHAAETKVWKFSYTDSLRMDGITKSGASSTTSAALAAGRQGLPLCRVYARFWGGDVTLMNVENWGCSFLIRLPKKRSVGQMFQLGKGDHYQTVGGSLSNSTRHTYPGAAGDLPPLSVP